MGKKKLHRSTIKKTKTTINILFLLTGIRFTIFVHQTNRVKTRGYALHVL